MKDNIVEIFRNKRILVFVPHSDDEINLMGSIFPYMVDADSEIRVVYCTNSDYFKHAKLRYKESIKALKKFGIEEANVILLGYSDNSFEMTDHYFLHNNEKCKSHSGHECTYAVGKKNEWIYEQSKIHHNYNRQNLVNDIMNVIIDFKPDILFASDLDRHPDHRSVSIAFDEAVGKILNSDVCYKPIVYKGFAYSTAFTSQNNYSGVNIKSTSNPAVNNLLDNPFYYWDDRIRIPVHNSCRTEFLHKNLIYKAFKKHKSQNGTVFAGAVAKGDKVFWIRNTNRLNNDFIIQTSSGNESFISDFLTLDTDEILNENNCICNYNKAFWMPDVADEKKSIILIAKKTVFIEELIIYGKNQKSIGNQRWTLQVKNGDVNTFESPRQEYWIKKIKLEEEVHGGDKILISQTGESICGISEIDIMPKCEIKIDYIKMCVNEDFIYDYYSEKKEIKLKVEAYCLAQGKIDANKFYNDIIICVNPKDDKNSYELKDDATVTIPYLGGRLNIVAFYKKNQCITDVINIHDYTDVVKKIEQKNTIIDRMYLIKDSIILRYVLAIYKRIFRIIERILCNI